MDLVLESLTLKIVLLAPLLDWIFLHGMIHIWEVLIWPVLRMVGFHLFQSMTNTQLVSRSRTWIFFRTNILAKYNKRIKYRSCIKRISWLLHFRSDDVSNNVQLIKMLVSYHDLPKCANHSLLISHWVHEKILLSAFHWLK